ncbi:MAG: multiple sugar transport system substrate-binding protein [Halanaerobiales bacterium]|nr:multiple sugar transport system substrate-binding protein [Halanaerobiales bacterium]
MKKLVRILIVFSLIITLSGTVFASKTTITFWHHEPPETRVAAYQKVIDLFEKENPDIHVVQEVVPWGDAYVKTQTAVAANATPDFQFALPDLNMAAYKMNAILPVTDVVNELDEKYTYFESQKAPFQIKGEYWAVPTFSWAMMLNYRPSLLKKYVGTTEPPKTWDELLEYAKKLHNPPEVYGIGLSVGQNLFTNEALYVFMATAGATVFDENGEVAFDSPETVKAVKYYQELFKYTPPGAETWSWGELELYFNSGKIAMAPYPPCLQRRFIEELDSTDYAAAPIPKPADGVEGSITYPYAVHVFKSAKEKGHLDEVKKFIKFMLRPDINAILTAEQEPGAFYPATVAAKKSEEFWSHPVIKKFEESINRPYFEVLDNASLYGFEYGYASNYGIGDIINANIMPKVLQKVISGNMSAEEAVKWGADKMEEYSKPIK